MKPYENLIKRVSTQKNAEYLLQAVCFTLLAKQDRFTKRVLSKNDIEVNEKKNVPFKELLLLTSPSIHLLQNRRNVK